MVKVNDTAQVSVQIRLLPCIGTLLKYRDLQSYNLVTKYWAPASAYDDTTKQSATRQMAGGTHRGRKYDNRSNTFKSQHVRAASGNSTKLHWTTSTIQFLSTWHNAITSIYFTPIRKYTKDSSGENNIRNVMILKNKQAKTSGPSRIKTENLAPFIFSKLCAFHSTTKTFIKKKKAKTKWGSRTKITH